MSGTDEWTEDGHVLVVTPDGEAWEEGDVSISVECPADHGGKCDGPSIACATCEGSGYLYGDDDEKPCPDCDESGRDGGKHTCWLKTHGLDDDDPDTQGDEPRWLLGRFKLLYVTDGYYDSFSTPMLRGDRLPVTGKDTP